MAAPLRIILVPGPRTGPSIFSGVADALWRRHQRAYVARLTDPSYLFPPYWMTQAATLAASLPEEDDMALVAHDGAGVLLPAVVRLSRNRNACARIRGCVFVDSDLPRNGASRFDLWDSRESAAEVRSRTNRFLPPFADRRLTEWVSDADARLAFAQERPRVPLDLYEEAITVPSDWPDTPCGYVALSSGHATAIGSAQAQGWPLVQVDGNPLAPLTEPDSVAETLLGVLHRMGASEGR